LDRRDGCPSFLAYVSRSSRRRCAKAISSSWNLRTHKIDGVRQAVERSAAKVRYLPAYSPALNPIEMAFSKLKTALRKGGRSHRDNADEADRQAHQDICTEQCTNYFRHAGYT